MKEQIKLVFLGNPVAQKRHRSRVAKWMPGGIHNYDPSAGQKQDFLSVIQKDAPEKPLEGPLFMACNFFFVDNALRSLCCRNDIHFHSPIVRSVKYFYSVSLLCFVLNTSLPLIVVFRM